MSVEIFSNNIPNPAKANDVADAARKALSDRAGRWRVHVYNPPITTPTEDAKVYYMTIEEIDKGWTWKGEFQAINFDLNSAAEKIREGIPKT